MRVSDCPQGYFESSQPTATSDRICSSVSPPCMSGYYQTAAPTKVADRVCTLCQEGSVASPGSAIGIEPCEACKPGTAITTSGQMGPCSAHSCPAGTADDDSDPTTECTQCAPGTFQAASGKTSCMAAATGCPAGQEITVAATITSDRVCTLCAHETFKANADGSQCTAVTSCTSGLSFEVTSPTSSTDRKCASCTRGCAVGTEWMSMACTDTADTVCTNVTECLDGEIEVSSLTATSDRICALWSSVGSVVVTVTDKDGNPVSYRQATSNSTMTRALIDDVKAQLDIADPGLTDKVYSVDIVKEVSKKEIPSTCFLTLTGSPKPRFLCLCFGRTS